MWRPVQIERQFTLECDFDRFRQMMVRLNPTRAIVSHGGMELISEKTEGVDIDTSNDERPILNAILGNSHSKVEATKTITVSVKDPNIPNTELTLRQKANISENEIHVVTQSIGEQQSIKHYVTTLDANADGVNTQIKIGLEMKIEVSVPKMFTSRADAGVNESAARSLAEQQKAITQFVIENSDKRIILPSIK